MFVSELKDRTYQNVMFFAQSIELQKKINEQTSAERLKELRLKNMQVEQITSEIAIVEATIKSKQKAYE